MSESIERRIIHKRIASLEEQVAAEHRHMDSLYEKYPFGVDKAQIQECARTISRMYDELLTLKVIILDADDEARLAAGS